MVAPEQTLMSDAIIGTLAENGSNGNGNRIEAIVLMGENDSLMGATPKDQALHLHLMDRMRSENKVLHLDVDHTFLNRGVKLTADGKFDPTQYVHKETGRSVELENIDLILLNALFGTAISVETGKDASIWPLATYMRDRLDFLSGQLQMTSKYNDGRLKTMDDTKPVVLIFTIGNGGYSIDLLATEQKGRAAFSHKPIPLSGWEGLQKEGNLLRDSTTQNRINLIGQLNPELTGDEKYTGRLPQRVRYRTKNDPYIRAKRRANKQGDFFSDTTQIHINKMTPITRIDQLHKEVEDELTPLELNHRMRLQADIRDFAVHVAGISSKANLVFDLTRIIQDKSLNKRWKRRTGIKIVNEDTLLEAFKVLSTDWQITYSRAFANGVTYIDVGAPGVDKKLSARLVKNYVQGLYRIYKREDDGIVDENHVPIISKVATLSHGDAPARKGENVNQSSNDAPMLNNTGSTTNARIEKQRRRINPWPIHLEDIYGNLDGMELTYRYLRDLLYAKVNRDNADELIKHLESERRLEHMGQSGQSG